MHRNEDEDEDEEEQLRRDGNRLPDSYVGRP